MIDSSLSICLFGSHLIRKNGNPYPIGFRGSTLLLLQYLLVHAGRELRRECVADKFWRRSSEARQRSCLNSAVWRINRLLYDLAGLNLKTDSFTLRFDIASDVPVDTRILDALVNATPTADAMDEELAKQLASALEQSNTPFLDGLMDDWALSERERISNIRLRGLTTLMHWYGDSHRYEDALEIGRRLLLEDPFRETAQIDVMWLYVLNRQRAQALKQYQSYTQLLHKELSIEPMVETRALYDHIRCGLNCKQPTMGLISDGITNRPVDGDNLNMMLTNIEKSRHRFYQTLRV